MSNKEIFESMRETCVTEKTIKACRDLVGGSKKYGMGGRWVADGVRYLALNGHLSRGSMPLKLKCKDGVVPISATDLEVLVKNKFVAGTAPVEFE